MKNDKKLFFITVIVLIVAVLIIEGIMFIKNNSKKNEESNRPIAEKSKEKDIEEDYLKNIKLLHEDKEIVYTFTKIKTFEYPAINIDSQDVKSINSEIKEHYGFTSDANLKDLSEESYNYYINENILSLVVKKGGNQSVYANSYNVDLKNGGERKSGKDLIEIKGEDEETVKQKALHAVKEEHKKVIGKDRTLAYEAYWDRMKYADEIEKSIESYTAKIKNLQNLYLDENNNLCMIVSFVHPGGDWICTKTVIVNITDNYSVKELKLNNGESSDNTLEIANRIISKITAEAQRQYEIEMIQPDSQAYPSTPDAITQDKAIELAKGIFGTKAPETGYEIVYTYYGWVKDKEGKEYYVINMHWKVEEQMQWVGAVCVAVDGTSYKQLGKQPTFQNGDIIEELIDGGQFTAH